MGWFRNSLKVQNFRIERVRIVVWIYLVGIDENEIGHTYIHWVTFSQVWILAMPEIIMQVTSQLAYKLPYFSHNIFQFLFYLSLNKSC